MKVSSLINTLQSQMGDEGVYRTDTFVLELINDGRRLLSLFTLYLEDSTNIDIDGTRNYVAFPQDDEKCIAPLYVADVITGARINPVPIEDLEFYTSGWEGQVSTVPHYYANTGLYSDVHAGLVVCPIGNYGRAKYYFIGAFMPDDVTATDSFDASPEQLRCIVEYCRFMCFIAEPARVEDAMEAYKEFIKRLNLLVEVQRKRYPSGRDVEPVPVELQQLGKPNYESKRAADEDKE